MGDNVVPGARAWSLWRKILTAMAVAGFSFLGTFATSVIAPGRPILQDELNVSRTMSVLTFSLFNLGLAWGSVLGSPLSESIGRCVVYLIAQPLLLIFVMATGFSHDLATILVCRLLGGLCGSPGITLASATISDVFEPGRARDVALFCYYSMPWLGSVLGPLVGSLIVACKPWEWSRWMFLFVAAPIVVLGLAFLKETKESVLEEGAANPRSSLDFFKPQNLKEAILEFGKTVPLFVQTSLLRPLKMLSTEMMVGLVCLYAGFNFGLIYALVIVFPEIFRETHNFDQIDQGLAFLGLIVGCIVGPACLTVDNEMTMRKVTRQSDEQKIVNPVAPSSESRLHSAMFGSFLLPVGLLWFCWTMRPSRSYLSPICASMLITLGALTIYVSTSAYITDVYGPKYGASASAASSIARYTTATIIPLFVLQMYDGLATGWATSILASAALLTMPIPFGFFRWGAALRPRCRFQTEQ